MILRICHELLTFRINFKEFMQLQHLTCAIQQCSHAMGFVQYGPMMGRLIVQIGFCAISCYCTKQVLRTKELALKNVSFNATIILQKTKHLWDRTIFSCEISFSVTKNSVIQRKVLFNSKPAPSLKRCKSKHYNTIFYNVIRLKTSLKHF